MFYEAQLRLIRDTFRKCRVATEIADPASPPDWRQELGLHAFLAAGSDPSLTLRDILAGLQESTVYRLQNPFGCRYIYFLLPEQPREALFIIGPFLTAAPSDEQFMEWAELMGISPSRLSDLKAEFSSLPVLPDSSQLFLLLDAFYEHLWGASGFNVEYLDQDAVSLPFSLESADGADQNATLREMQQMELRYGYENELMQAVTKGHLHKADILLGSFSAFLFEQRVADPLRNAKNYCIIMNTLLRKAAQQGGVHPIHLDKLSSGFAFRIEQQSSPDGVPALMMDMFRSYCRLVRKRTMKDYSPIVQQAILSIEANLSGALSLSSIAKILNISGSYLSTIFKKETGQTLTDYISACRVDKAMELLRTTKLQIQTIAQHCGIMDVHYFSRIFKKVTGQTPKEYRAALKR